MALTDLKRTVSDKKAVEEMYAIDGPGGDDYSYGLNINLEAEELDKLEIGKLDVGQEVMITAMAKVTSFSENQNEKQTNRSAGLVIQKMDLVQGSGDVVKTLYGDNDGQ